MSAKKHAARAMRAHGAFALVLVAVAIGYGLTAARHVLGHDNGEYVTVGNEGGVTHPPGYPLYMIWLRAWSWLPADSGAQRASLSTLMLGIATAALLYLACQRWHASRIASAAAVAVYATSARAWLLSTHAENLALNALLAALLLLLAAPATTLEPMRRASALGLLAGLGLANHHTIVLLFPVGIWALVRAARASRSAVHAVGAAGLGALLGATPYLSLLAMDGDERWSWGRFQGLGDLFDHALRLEYGSFSLVAQQDLAHVAVTTRLAAFAVGVAADLLWLFPLLGLWAMAMGLSGIAKRPRRQLGPAMLALSFVLCGPLLASQLELVPRGIGLYQVARFHLMPELLLTVFVARGLHQLLRRIVRGLPRALLAGLPLALALIGALVSAPQIREHHRPTVELYMTNTLRSLPDGAVLMGMGDLRLFSSLYLQRIEGVRRDVVFVMPTMLFREWYRERVEQRLSVKLDMVTPRGIDMPRLAATLMASGRALFIMDADQNHLPILQAYDNYPFGTAIRILPPNSPRPSTEELEHINQRLFDAYEIEASPPRAPDGFGAWVYRDYARPWHFVAEEWREQGRTEEAQRAQRIEETFLLR